MNKPNVNVDDRGITLNKSLAWTMVVGLIGAGVWLGTETTTTKSAVQALAETQKLEVAETTSYRRETNQRIRVLESSKATNGTEIQALRRDITGVREDIRELKQLLRAFEMNVLGTP